ncbi:hypothetical protein CBR_g52662 [Chara braunii]|uniref:F-box domain-containing protein n=1 Tax=Chara braunii TaxID=69332 RepID=A0A388MAN3_CHABU|nr:hypothetical protein CBR_g52662 [Chara braunii]|eukprot:GBG91628.1 hypothetical protein CBR_g52662 [Chara braunii]
MEDLHGETDHHHHLSRADLDAVVGASAGSSSVDDPVHGADVADSRHDHGANESHHHHSGLRREDLDVQGDIRVADRAAVDGAAVDGAAVDAWRDWSTMVGEVLAHIFSVLPIRERFRVGSVCKSWRRVSAAPESWTEAEVMLVSWPKVKQCMEEVLLRSRGRLLDLTLADCDNALLQKIGDTCPLLRRLHIVSFHFQAEWIRSVEAFVRGCPRVRSLMCFGIDTHCAPRSDTDLSDFARVVVTGLPHLVSLSLGGSGFGGKADQVLSTVIADHAAQLEVLGFIFLQITAVDLARLGQRLPSLRSLLFMDVSISDDDVRVIADNFPNLEILELWHAKITDASLDLIGQKMDKLRVLQVSRCRALTQERVSSLRSRRKDLNVVTAHYQMRMRMISFAHCLALNLMMSTIYSIEKRRDLGPGCGPPHPPPTF